MPDVEVQIISGHQPSPTRLRILLGFLSYRVKKKKNTITWVPSSLCESCCLPGKNENPTGLWAL